MSSRKSQDETAGMLSAPHSFESEGMAFDVRPGFIRKVYGILTAQLVLTFGLIFVMVFVEPVKIQMCGGVDNLDRVRGGCKEPTDTLHTALITSCVLSFVFLCTISCCGSLARKVPHNYILLFCFTLCEAIMLGIMCLFLNAVSVGLAALMTALVTAGLTAYACKTTTDFTGMGGYLFAALLTLMVCGFVGGMFSAFYHVQLIQNIYAGLGCLIFSFYIVYDTQLIVGGKHSKYQFDVDDYVFAALNIYLDIINLFIYILQLLSSRD